MIDRNKSPLTHEVTNAAIAWLNERGFKPVETEVPISNGWVADIAGVICPTATELVDLKLLRRRPDWKVGQPLQDLWKLDRNSLPGVMTCLCEVKISRTDFIGDKKWGLVPPTDLAFLVFPSRLVEAAEYPCGWGILNYSGAGIRQVRPAIPRAASADEQLATVLSIAVRRDHHTRYARLRELRKQRTLYQGEQKMLRRSSQIARAFLQIAHGKHDSVRGALEYNGVGIIGSAIEEELEGLWGILGAPGCARSEGSLE